MLVRRILFVSLAALAAGIGVVPAGSALADEVITSSFDTMEPRPGTTVNLKVTFKNPETYDVMFTFLTVNMTYDTITDGTKFKKGECTGEIVDCDHYTTPIPPGATRTLTMPIQIEADSPCGTNINLGFFFYNYRESAAGAFDLVAYSPVATVIC
ncbi:hypothetical protein AGRA3207_002499 [Actinomadura graeca]|uniref:Uncharacterized protein n=1 Tax=Actinomadura graeca TaxID=2750812 RepID=A0ABX8QW00_9ACTN|nr:hypothetical protein [Actinomadura graeca]QXJ21627.1 hypothetical protein AGRA3207_002499 [Actinomadura graeca]